MGCPARDRGFHSVIGGAFTGLLRAASTALAGIAFLAASSTALAGIPNLDVSVTSLIPTTPNTTTRVVSYSTDSVTYQAAYAVSIANNTSSNINDIFFSIITTSSNGVTIPFGTVSGLRQGDSCDATPNGAELDCHFISLPAGSAPISLTLLIPSPKSTGPDSILGVAWGVQTGQGKPNPSNFIHQGSQDVTLRVGSAKNGVQSYVNGGGNLKVADGGTSTNVTTPKPVAVGVQQVVDPSSCSPHYKKCFQSTIRIVDPVSGALISFTTDPLVIDLFRASSSLKQNSDFANAQLLYKGDDNIWRVIPTCGPGNVVPADPPNRCVTPAVAAGTAVVGDTGVDASGNWLFHVLAGTNGIINW